VLPRGHKNAYTAVGYFERSAAIPSYIGSWQPGRATSSAAACGKPASPGVFAERATVETMRGSTLKNRANRLAIVGFAFRFPGPPGDAFWTALCDGRNLVTTVDASRWSQSAFFHPRKSEPGTSYSFAAGSLGDISTFDAEFFGISPREAAHMDPQQRMLLELAWEAFESGGIRPSAARGCRSGVYVGFSGSDFSYRRVDDLSGVDAFTMTGSAASIAANRISYAFDLKGPSVAVDTACSSALVAVHHGCQTLLSGETDLSVVGAVSLHLHPLAFIGFSKASMLSAKGACRAFDAAADGYVRSEGGAVVVLKRLEDAVAAGDRVFGVIAGSGLNCDGRTSSLTVPSHEAQAALLSDVYARAGIDPAEIDYLEAHGTGTAVGDPIEARGISEALASRRPADRPLAIGSVKANLGHLETAAGMAGLVKALYCLRHRAIPPSAHFNTPNPRIPFDEWNLRVVSEQISLDPHKRLVIGVNSFGFGGANAHVALESPPSRASAPRTRTATVADDTALLPLVISGHTEAALKAAAKSHAQWLNEKTQYALYDIAHAAAFKRDWHAYRAIAFAAGRKAMSRALTAFARDDDASGVTAGRALPAPSGLAFVYSGNASQWSGMGHRLLLEDATFRAAVEAVDRCFSAYSDFRIAQTMARTDIDELLQATEVAQPLLFALQVGLTQCLRACGLSPTMVIGHSVGEIAAAWACGALSLEQATQVVYHRSAWQAVTRGLGAMTAAALSEDDAQTILRSIAGGTRLTIAAVNSPSSVTMAGPGDALTDLEKELAARGVRFRRLALEYAFHSPAMDAIREDIERALGQLEPNAADVPFVSAVDGARCDGRSLDGHYWWRNIREPVRFGDGILRLVESGTTVFLEVGPQPVLGGYVNECLRHTSVDGRCIPTMMRSADGVDALRAKAAQVAIAGCPTDLSVWFPEPAEVVDLPSYPWQRERHWYTPTPEAREVVDRTISHVLLGSRQPETNRWEAHLDTCVVPAMADHRVGGETIFPAAGFVEMALAASAAFRADSAREIEDLEIRAPLVLHENRSKTVRFGIDSSDGTFVIRSRDRLSSDPWRLHVTGRLALGPATSVATVPLVARARGQRISAQEHYQRMARAGLEYGPAFQRVVEIWRDGQTTLGEIEAAPPLAEGMADCFLHPCTLDAALQLLAHALPADDRSRRTGLALMPVRIGKLVLHQGHASVRFARVRAMRIADRSVVANFSLYDTDGRAVASLREVRFRVLPMRDPTAGFSLIETRVVPAPIDPWRAPVPLPALDGIVDACAAHLHAPARVRARARYLSDAEPLLEVLLAAFAKEALSQAPEVVADRRALLEGLQQLCGDGEYPEARALWADLVATYPDQAAEINWIGRVGLRLPDFLRGTAVTIAARPADPQLAQAIGHVLAELVHALPADGPRLRIAVIDKGDEQFTARALAQCDPRRCEFVVFCTDPAILESRADLAARYAGCSVHSVDLGQPAPALPKEAREPFHVVLVGDGACPPTNCARALANVRDLMSDQALLVVAEYRRTDAVSLAVDLLAHCAILEPHAPAGEPASRSEQDWRALLEAHGFAQQVTVPEVPDSANGSFLLFAAAAPRAARGPEPAPGRRWCLVTDRAERSRALAAQIAEALCDRGQQARIIDADEVTEAAFGQLSDIVDLQALSGTLAQQLDRCVSLAMLLEQCAAEAQPPRIWILTAQAQRDPEAALVWGFGRSAMNEYPRVTLRLADLDRSDDEPADAAAIAQALLTDDAEDEIVIAPEGRRAVRFEPAEIETDAAEGAADDRAVAVLDLAAPGQLKHLYWTRRPLPALDKDDVEIEVRAAGLNFRDVMSAMGQLSDEALEGGFAGPTLGMELSGVVTATGGRVRSLRRGDEVIAFARSSFATRVVTKASAVIRKPENWSFEAASTVPIAFLTAHYALLELGGLGRGQKVLIHGAAGGVGTAAIQIAQSVGAEIFATAGSDEKRDFLCLHGVQHILDSRSLAFADEIMRLTRGQGVDVVLNSLSGEAMSRSLRVLKPFGRFLELGKRDYYENTRVGLRPFRNNISYFGIDVDQLMLERPDLTRRLLRDLMSKFKSGTYKPLPYRAFAADEVVDAFRYMQQSKQIGKVVVSCDPPPRAPSSMAAAVGRRLALPAHATYLVTGGMRGFGLRTAQWLADRGARNLVLVGRSTPSEPAFADTLAALEARGVRVKVANCDVSDHALLEALLDEVRGGFPPLRGIVHAAAVIDDGLIRTMTRARLEGAWAPKAQGAANLDALTRADPLDFFVLYSSATTVFGNPGQAGYVAANRYLEVLASTRRAQGLPALCVGWGPIADAGYLASRPAVREALEGRIGGSALPAEHALTILERMLLSNASGFAVLKFDRGGPPRLLNSSPAPKFGPLLAGFAKADRLDNDREGLRRRLCALDDEALAAELRDLVKQEVGEVLRIAAEKIDARKPLQEIGLDSLMGVELMTAMEARFGVDIPVMALAELTTIDRLVERLAKELRSVDIADEHADGSDLDAQVRQTAARYARDIDPQQLAEFAAQLGRTTPE
jgi:phthiocerol/phenolphthiocerol synthesis type-I polyketide synthase C